MAKSEDARILDNAIRAANARATYALYTDDEDGFADASADLASLRDMRLTVPD